MSSKGFDQGTIASKVGIPPFAVRKNQAQAKGFSLEQLKTTIKEGVDLEESVKTGRLNDQMAVELFIVRYSKKG